MNTQETDNECLARAAKIVEGQWQEQKTTVDHPMIAQSLVQYRLSQKEHEVFLVMFLTAQSTLIACEEMFRGTIDAASIYPREVVKRVLELNAKSVIFAHNHPSGDNTPSEPDKKITKRLQDALALIDVQVLDHIIVGEGKCSSFAEKGLL